MIQTDNLDVIKALTDIELEDSGITLLRRLHRIMRTEEQWQIRYVSREHNTVVDWLAKLSLTRKSSLQVFDVAPIEIIEVLQRDESDKVRKRMDWMRWIISPSIQFPTKSGQDMLVAGVQNISLDSGTANNQSGSMSRGYVTVTVAV
ncbi:hypothetical protein Gogos_010741 [Gossypium gossypioides]|uniref:RNase H type-1 domain-containing protein n=1 Tax=Gossypium gossypioides TaxID=34282 RepID=A0A7J9BM60_GOSGO|nr:hypothetical protein [Gossypium gossypioides]